MAKKNMLRNQEGFTLIEIIAVLVILGILSAVAVPKFIDLQADAKKSTVKGALASGKSTITQAYAKAMLSAKGLPTATQVLGVIGTANATSGAVDDVQLGDFKASFASGTGGILVTITSDADGTNPSGYTGVTAADYSATVKLDLKQAN